MYENSSEPVYSNLVARPCRIQCNRWSFDKSTNLGQPSEESTVAPAASFYFPYSQRAKQTFTPNYVNFYPASSSHLSNYERPKSSILCDSNSTDHSTFHVNDLRQRYESKTLVGIVKPMVHQRSNTQLNNNNNESKVSDVTVANSYHYNSVRSLHPSPISTPPLTSSVIYRTRPTLCQNNMNGQPPVAPRRYSSISTNKRTSSHRSSRTTSTSSSIVAINEVSSKVSSHENEQQNNDKTIVIDIKRLEMFYASVGTLVKSARSIARLYITTTRQLANFEDWSCQQVGVPVWIYNTVCIV